MKKRLDRIVKIFIKYYKKYFLALFLISMILGFVYGLIDTNFYKGVMKYDAERTVGSIFFNNIMVSLFEFFTAGFWTIFVNFKTFALGSNMMISEGIMILLPLSSIHGITEMYGFFLVSKGGISLYFNDKEKDTTKLFVLGAFLILYSTFMEVYITFPIYKMVLLLI